jgi:hypothetical protein
MSRNDSAPSEILARAFSPGAASPNPSERAPAAAAHVLSLLPLWGVVFAAGINHYYKESSRIITFQARQAIFLHLVFLAIAFTGILIRFGAGVLEAAFPEQGFAEAAAWFDYSKAIALYAAYCIFPAATAALVSMGRNVVYPFIGRRLWPPMPRDGMDSVY